MWASRYWPVRYWASRYWPKVDGAAAVVSCGCAAYGDGSLYGDGELYCDSTFTRRIYLVVRDMVYHNLSVRFQAAGRFVLDNLRALTHIRATKPHQYEVTVARGGIKALSIRVQATGCMKLDRIKTIVRINKQQPVV